MSTDPKNIIFWRCIIGHIQRYAPANYGQMFAQGIRYWKKSNRSFAFQFGQDMYSFFPLDSNPTYRLGYDYAVGVDGVGSPCGPTEPWDQYSFSLFVKRKNALLAGTETESQPDPDDPWQLLDYVQHIGWQR